MILRGRTLRVAAMREMLGFYPEWWTLALSTAAWGILLSRRATAPGHAREAWALVDHTLAWMLMVVAMMVPLVLGAIRTTAVRSLWRRRNRAIAWFLAGYLAPWMMVGLAVPAAAAVNPGLPGGHLGAPALVIAAAWQVSQRKKQALLRCHQTIPLAPRGLRAIRDCIRFGSLIGTRCVASCWALMLVCWLTSHQLIVLGVTAGIAISERYLVRLDPRLTALVLLGLATGFAATAH
jgi:predicted metal-binding membrane protein